MIGTTSKSYGPQFARRGIVRYEDRRDERAKRVIVSVLALLASLSANEVKAKDSSTSAQQPLACCAIMEIPTAGGTTGDGKSMVLQPLGRRTESPVEHYRHGFGAAWDVSHDVDREDPRVRFLLLTPGGPRIIDLDLYIHGKPFQAIREQWIDEALQAANETLVEAPEGAIAHASKLSEKVPSTGNEPSEGKDPRSDDSGIKPVVHKSPSARERLARYVTHHGEGVDRNEARWLLAQWTPGPVLLMLRDGFATERAAMAPVFAVVDRDGNASLSLQEIEGAAMSLRRADANEDDVLEVAELWRATEGTKAQYNTWAAPQLLVPLVENTHWEALFQNISDLYVPGGSIDATRFSRTIHLVERLDQNRNGVWELAESRGLKSVPPDLGLRISMGYGDDIHTGMELEHISPDMGSAGDMVCVSDRTITVELGGSYLELSAAQPARSRKSESLDQVAIGAVVDGLPLLRLLDQDNDRRLSVRECQAVATCLRDQDLNGDGQIGASEIAVPLRLTVTLGSYAHEVLSKPTCAARRSRAPKGMPPAWFTSMDGNNDGDLSRNEFLGTQQQFHGIDADRDGLISIAEAQNLKAISKP